MNCEKKQKYGIKVIWNVKWYGQYERKVSWMVKKNKKYGRKVIWNVKWYGQYERKEC